MATRMDFTWTMAGETRTKPVAPSRKDGIRLEGINDHDALLFSQSISIPPSTNVILSARAWRSDPRNSDVQVGIMANNETRYGYWTGRDAQVTSPVCQIPNASGEIGLILRFAGEWGTHACEFSDIRLEYEPISQDPGPQPDPDQGIAGQIAELCAQVSATLEKISELLAKQKEAEEWVKEYNEHSRR